MRLRIVVDVGQGIADFTICLYHEEKNLVFLQVFGYNVS